MGHCARQGITVMWAANLLFVALGLMHLTCAPIWETGAHRLCHSKLILLALTQINSTQCNAATSLA